MAKKKHQHFIPKTYLKRFAHRTDGDTSFVDTINVKTNEIKQDFAISNLCVDCDLYTLRKLSGDEKYKIEDFFNTEIENDYSKVFDLLIDSSIENIGLEQRAKILKTIFSLYFRTPKVLNEFVDTSISFFKELKSEDVGEFTFMNIRIDLKNQSLNQIKREIREKNREDFIKANLILMSEFIKQRSFDGIIVIKLIGNQEFITSDNPVTICNGLGKLNDIFSFDNAVFIPIDPKHCVFISPTTGGAIVNKIYRLQDNLIQQIVINNYTFKNAERWCIGTRTGIPKFVTENEEYSKPADNNHPIVKQAIQELEIMKELTRLAEKGADKHDLSELYQYVRDHKEDESFKKNAAFSKLVGDFKKEGKI